MMVCLQCGEYNTTQYLSFPGVANKALEATLELASTPEMAHIKDHLREMIALNRYLVAKVQELNDEVADLKKVSPDLHNAV